MMMTIKLYTDKELKEFCDMRKRVTNPGARWLEKPTRKPVHRQRSFKASSEQDENLVAGEGEPGSTGSRSTSAKTSGTIKTFLVGLPTCRMAAHA